jgi:plasmid stabilization system protein ParE
VANKFRILFEPTADRELEEAIRWYKRQRPGLEDELAREVNRCLKRIQASPEMYARVKKDYRRAMIDRFPYAIYYEFIADTIIVYSIFHGSRNPSDLDNLLP